MGICALTYSDADTFEGNLKRQFKDWNLVYQRRQKISEMSKTHDWTTFFELTNAEDTATVFAVRGTHGFLDVMQDINIFAPVVITQLAALMGPDLRYAAAKAV